MAYTQAQIDALRLKINSFAGVRGTSIADQRTDFDMDGALKLLAIMEAEVSVAAGTAHRTRYAVVSKGFDAPADE